MLRTWLSLALLAAAVSALAAWLFQYRAPADGPPTHALSMLKAAEVKRIRVEPAEGAAAELERGADAWRIVKPFEARADAARVERLLAILDARSAALLKAEHLARYDLEHPRVKVTMGGQTFAYGAVNEATREQYVLTNDGVYAIPLSQRVAVPRNADMLISRALFAPGEIPIRIDLPDFTAALERGTWGFVPPAADVSADERNAWAEGWRSAAALGAVHHEGTASGTDVFTVGLKDGRAVELRVLAREPELVLLRADEGVRYHFAPDVAKKLISPPRPPRSEAAGK